MKIIHTSKWLRSLEAIVEIGFKLVAVYFVYLGFNWLVTSLLGKDVSEETLTSILLLPALFIIKDADQIIDPLTVKVHLHSNRVSATRGLAVRVNDTLEYKSVENVEVIKTILGRIAGYSTIRLYSPGGSVEIPFAYKAEKVTRIIFRHKNKST